MALLSRSIVCAALVGAALVPAAAASAQPVGVWINDTGRGAIEIKPCERGLCGHVVWVEDQSDVSGCGKQIIGDVVEVSRGVWDGGWIYSPERKRRYDVELSSIDDQRLRVVGYAGSKLFSKSMVWTRAPADLPRCDAVQASAPAGQPPVTAAPQTATREPAAASPIRPVSTPSPAVRADAPSIPVETKNRPPAERRADLQVKPSDRAGDLPIERYFTKTPDGECVLDLPWVKVNFPCEKR